MSRSPRQLLRRSLRSHPVASLGAAVLGVSAAGVLGGLAAVIVAGGGGAHSVQLLGAATVMLVAAAAAAIAAVASTRGRANRRFARLLAVALGLVSLGAASWWMEVLKARDAAPMGRHDLIFLAAGVIAVVACATHPDLASVQRRSRPLVDAIISGLSVSVILWLIAGRQLAARSGDPVAAFGAVLCVGASLVVTRLCISILLARDQGTPTESAGTLVTLGFATISVAALAHLIDHAYAAAAWFAVGGDAAMVLGTAAIGVAGLMMLAEPRTLPWSLSRPRLRSLSDLMPILISAVATIALLADVAHAGRFDPTASAVLTVAITAVLLRQSLTLSDNRELSASLRATVNGLEQQATHDTLTGLPNRHGLDDRLALATRRSAIDGKVCAVYFIDVDRLKSVNDSLGHHAGDLLIRGTADRLTARVGARVTRFGGDEFVLVVEDLPSPGAAEELGRRIVVDMARPIELEGHRIRSSASVGLTIAEPDLAPDELLRRADVALYRAKALGRSCLVAYRAEDDPGLHDDLDIETELRRAVERDEFTLHYQPIVDLGTGEMVSVEALLRWQHPERGLLGPEAFLDEAIATGLLGTIGETSLRRACHDFASVDESAWPDSRPSVAVNLSSSELADRRVVERVAAALTDSGLPATRLTLEITEDVIVDDAVRATIDRLCALGARLAIDDFGTGNSSLRQVGAYPATVLKVDRSFVERIVDDERARSITAAIARLARNLGLTTVAEGVETEEQADLLTRMGCDRAQGWLFARAMPLDELVQWCGDRARASVDAQGYGTSRESVASASSMMRASSSATGGRSSIAPTT